MDSLLAYFPPSDKGLLPYYLFVVCRSFLPWHRPKVPLQSLTNPQVGIVSVGNSIQNLITLHYTRRLYNGVFVPNHAALRQSPANGKSAEDSVNKLIPASSTGKDTEKAQDQVTPLAARVFGVWTMLAGIIRMYTAQDTDNRALYQLSLITHAVAAVHFTSEILVFKTMRLTGPQLFPLAAGIGGTIWMTLQYSHYVSA